MTIVVHVPHASTFVPEDVVEQFQIPRAALEAEAQTSADLYTDLLAHAAWPNAQIIAAPVSRLVVDVERYADDTQEVMAHVGRGMIYTHTHDGIRMRRTLSNRERILLKEKWYDPHWSRLRSAASEAVIIDLHSYPAKAWPVEPDHYAERSEIDLGTSEALTPSDWVARMSEHFRACGYDVGINTPYAGVIDAGSTAAVMIEIRRDVIGNPSGCEKWRQLSNCLSSMPTNLK